MLEGGLTIETTLDLDLQRAAARAVRQGLEALDRRQGYRGPTTEFTLNSTTASGLLPGSNVLFRSDAPCDASAGSALTLCGARVRGGTNSTMSPWSSVAEAHTGTWGNCGNERNLLAFKARGFATVAKGSQPRDVTAL